MEALDPVVAAARRRGIPFEERPSAALFDWAAAKRLADVLVEERLLVIGVEGFAFDGTHVRPDHDAILDLATSTDPAAAAAEACMFIADLEPRGLHFEFVVEPQPAEPLFAFRADGASAEPEVIRSWSAFLSEVDRNAIDAGAYDALFDADGARVQLWLEQITMPAAGLARALRRPGRAVSLIRDALEPATAESATDLAERLTTWLGAPAGTPLADLVRQAAER